MPPRSNIFVVGGDSQLGSALALAHSQRGDNVRVTTRRAGSARAYHLDLARLSHNWLPPANVQIAYVCAGITAIQQCEERPAETNQINSEATARLCSALCRAGAFVVFFSTNLVFNGEESGVPVDASPQPRCVYGTQKATVERVLQELGCPAAIVRLTKVIDPAQGLLRTWHAALLRGEPVAAFTDMTLAPVLLESAVRATVNLATQRVQGIAHLSARHDITYFEAAQRLAKNIGAPLELVQPASARATLAGNRFIPRHTSLAPSRHAQSAFVSPDPFLAVDAVGNTDLTSLSLAQAP